MYINQVKYNRDSWWGYLLTVILIVPITVVLFSIPHGFILTAKAFGDEELMAKIASGDMAAMMSVLEPNLNLFLMLLPFVGMLLAVFFSTKIIHKNSIRELTTSRKKIDWSRVLFAFCLWGSISATMIFLDYNFFTPEDYEWNFKPVPFLILCAIVVVLLPIQTSAEEYLFRGYLMQGIGVLSTLKKFILYAVFIIPIYLYFVFFLLPEFTQYVFINIFGIGIGEIFPQIFYVFVIIISAIYLSKIGDLPFFKKLYESKFYINLSRLFSRNWLPLIITSLAFGLMHYANPEIAKFGNVVYVFYIGSGLFAGIMTLMDEGLELALGWHAANNMVAALLVTADWTALQTHSLLKDISNPETMPLGEVLIPVLVFFPAILLIFANKYNWTDWKGKLFGSI